MKKQTILKAGLFFALAVQISWNTHQAQNNNQANGQANFASISKSNTAAHNTNTSVFLNNQINNTDPLKVRIGSDKYTIDLDVQEGINNLCATSSSQNTSLLSQLSTSSTTRNDVNCGSTTLTEYVEANMDSKDKLQKDVFQKVELKNLPKDVAENLSKRMNVEFTCDTCDTTSVVTRVYSKSANTNNLEELRNQLSAVLSLAVEDTAEQRKEREKQLKKFKRLAKRMQQCEVSTPDGLEEILDITDIDELELKDINYNLVEGALDSSVKRYSSSSDKRMECKKDRFERLVDNQEEEAAEEFFFKHMQSDLADYVRSNPRKAKALVEDISLLTGSTADGWDPLVGLEDSYTAVQMLGTELKFREDVLTYAKYLQNPNLAPGVRAFHFNGLQQLQTSYEKQVEMFNSNYDKDSLYRNDLNTIFKSLDQNIGVNLTSLQCDTATQLAPHSAQPQYVMQQNATNCNGLTGVTASDVYANLTKIDYMGGVQDSIPTDYRDIIISNRSDLIPRHWSTYLDINNFVPSIASDRVDMNKLTTTTNRSNSMQSLSDRDRLNLQRNRPENRRMQ